MLDFNVMPMEQLITSREVLESLIQETERKIERINMIIKAKERVIKEQKAKSVQKTATRGNTAKKSKKAQGVKSTHATKKAETAKKEQVQTQKSESAPKPAEKPATDKKTGLSPIQQKIAEKIEIAQHYAQKYGHDQIVGANDQGKVKSLAAFKGNFKHFIGWHVVIVDENGINKQKTAVAVGKAENSVKASVKKSETEKAPKTAEKPAKTVQKSETAKKSDSKKITVEYSSRDDGVYYYNVFIDGKKTAFQVAETNDGYRVADSFDGLESSACKTYKTKKGLLNYLNRVA